MFHPCCRPTSHPSCLLAREESDFISPMKLLAAEAVCTVRCCASPALRDEEGREDGGAELAVFRQNCSVHPGSQGIPADLRDDEQAGKCTHRLFRLVPLGGVAECQTLLCVQNPAIAPGRWQQASSCSHSPSASAGGCSFVRPACLCRCLACHRARTTPAVLMHERTRCYLRSTRALQACDNGIEAISELEHAGAALGQHGLT